MPPDLDVVFGHASHFPLLRALSSAPEGLHIRALARRLQAEGAGRGSGRISPTTVSEAVRRLEGEGVLVSEVGLTKNVRLNRKNVFVVCHLEPLLAIEGRQDGEGDRKGALQRRLRDRLLERLDPEDYTAVLHDADSGHVVVLSRGGQEAQERVESQTLDAVRPLSEALGHPEVRVLGLLESRDAVDDLGGAERARGHLLLGRLSRY